MAEFRLLGAIDISSTEARSAAAVLAQPKRVAILAYLALATPRGYHRRDSLLLLFWPDADQARARAALSQALYTIRQSLGEDCLLTRGDEEVSLNWDKWSCDAVELRVAAAAERHEDVLRLYRGELLTGFHANASPEFEQWLDGERAEAHKAALTSAHELAARAEARQRYRDAIAWLRKAAALDPLDENVVESLMRLLHRSGDNRAALAEYDAFAARLAADLEETPPATLTALADNIRNAPAPARRLPRLAGVGPRKVTFGVVALLAVAVPGGWYAAHRDSAPINSQRVVVLPFKNATGDTTLAELGMLIADELTQAVASSGFAQAVPSPEVRLSRSIKAFARDAAAGMVITGRYFLADDTIIIEAHAISFRGRQQDVGVPRIRGPRAHPDALAALARDQVMGVVAVQFDRPGGGPPLATHGIKPPSFEAYRAYNEGSRLFIDMQYDDAAAAFQRALQLDSSFYAAGVLLGWSQLNGGHHEAAETTWLAVAPHRNELDQEARADFEGGLAFIDGDWARAYRVIRDLPDRQSFTNHDLAGMAMALRRPHEALRLMRASPPREYLVGTERWSGFYTYITNALFVLGSHEEELRAARRGRALFPDLPRLQMLEGRALAALGRSREAGARVEAVLPRRPDWALEVIEVMALRDTAAARRLYQRSGVILDRLPNPSFRQRVARANIMLGLHEYDRARVLCETLHSELPRNPEALLCLGLAQAYTGDRVAAAATERELSALPGVQVDRADNIMRRAMIAAALDERAFAVQYIADAYAAGYRYQPVLLYAPAFAKLHGYPPFEELMRPLD